MKRAAKRIRAPVFPGEDPGSDEETREKHEEEWSDEEEESFLQQQIEAGRMQFLFDLKYP